MVALQSNRVKEENNMNAKTILAGTTVVAALTGAAPPLGVSNSLGKRGSGNFRPGVNSNVGSLSAPANVEQVPKELKHGVNTAQRHLLGTVNATDISLAEAIKTVEDAIRYFDDDEASTSDSFHYSRLARVVEQYSHQLGDVATQFNSQCPNLIWSMLLSCKLTLSDLLNSLNEMNKFMSSTTVVSSTNQQKLEARSKSEVWKLYKLHKYICSIYYSDGWWRTNTENR